MATQVSNMFCNFYLVKNCKININSTTTALTREKISADLVFMKL
jgi:hypothetical protein